MYLFIYFSNILFIHLRAETSLTLLPHIRSLSDSRIAPIAKYLRLVTSVHQKERMNIHTHLLTAPHRERETHTHTEREGGEKEAKRKGIGLLKQLLVVLTSNQFIFIIHLYTFNSFDVYYTLFLTAVEA